MPALREEHVFPKWNPKRKFDHVLLNYVVQPYLVPCSPMVLILTFRCPILHLVLGLRGSEDTVARLLLHLVDRLASMHSKAPCRICRKAQDQRLASVFFEGAKIKRRLDSFLGKEDRRTIVARRLGVSRKSLFFANLQASSGGL